MMCVGLRAMKSLSAKGTTAWGAVAEAVPFERTQRLRQSREDGFGERAGAVARVVDEEQHCGLANRLMVSGQDFSIYVES